MALTGRFTFRRSLTGRIVLQVEEEVRAWWPRLRHRNFKKRWRDATLMDLAAPEMRALIDLRYKPQFMSQSYLAPVDTTLSQPAEQEFREGASAESVPNHDLTEHARVLDLSAPGLRQPAPKDVSVQVERVGNRLNGTR